MCYEAYYPYWHVCVCKNKTMISAKQIAQDKAVILYSRWMYRYESRGSRYKLGRFSLLYISQNAPAWVEIFPHSPMAPAFRRTTICRIVMSECSRCPFDP
jgi:hypothetical protein